ncbi:unnamed protein product, partial [Symbiodinium sp. CCMP2456]
MGYRAFYASKGPTWQRNGRRRGQSARHFGGVLLAVRDDVRATVGAKHVGDDGEYVAMDLATMLTKPQPHRAMLRAKAGKGHGQDPAAWDSGGGTKAPGIAAAAAKRKIIAEESIDTDYIRVSNQKEAHLWGPDEEEVRNHEISILGKAKLLEKGEEIQTQGWERRGGFVVFYLKIPKGDGDKYLNKSGLEKPIFISKLVKDVVKQCPVKWITAEEGESAYEYFERARKEAKNKNTTLSFRRGGGNYLGVRVDVEEAGVCHSWVLWEVTLLSRRVVRKTKAVWTLRAKSCPKDDYFESKFDDCTLVAVVNATRASGGKTTHRYDNSAMTRLNPNKAAAATASTPEVAATQVDALSMDVEAKADEKGGEEQKKNLKHGASPAKDAKPKRAKKDSSCDNLPEHMTVVALMTKRSCLFEAAAIGLNRALSRRSSPLTHRTFRATVADQLKKYERKFRCLVNTSWGDLAPRWQRSLSTWASSGDKIQTSRVKRVAVACLLNAVISFFLIRQPDGPMSPKNCGGARPGLRAAMRRHIAGLDVGNTSQQARAQAARPTEPSFCRPVSREDHAGSDWTMVEGRRKQGAAVQQWNVDPLVGGLLGLGVVKRRLADGMPLGGHLVVSNDQAELDTIGSLARSHELKEALSVICRFVPTGEAKTMQLPSVGPKGQKQVRSWPAVTVSAGNSPAPQRKAVLKATFAAPDRKLVTLRLQVPKAFCEPSQWDPLCKQPNDLVRRSLGPVHSLGVWQKIQSGDKDHRELVLECYAKVAEGDKAAVLARSGSGGVLVEELTRDQPKPNVDWIRPGDVEGPAYLQLVQRQAKVGGGSLAFRRGGGAALGIRIDPSKAGDRVQTWRARKVPRDWTEEDLRGAFEAATFSDFEVVAPGRGSLPWLVRGKLKGDEGLPALVIQTDHHCIDVERAVAKRRLENVKTERLPIETKRAASEKTAPGPSKPPAAPDAVGGSGGNGKAVGKVAQAATGAVEPAVDRLRSRSPTRAQPDWFDIHDCGGAGSCLFNVVGAHYAVYRDGQTWKDAIRLAKARGATLRSEPADETEKVNLEQMEGGAPPTTWEAYLQALDRPGRIAIINWWRPRPARSFLLNGWNRNQAVTRDRSHGEVGGCRAAWWWLLAAAATPFFLGGLFDPGHRGLDATACDISLFSLSFGAIGIGEFQVHGHTSGEGQSGQGQQAQGFQPFVYRTEGRNLTRRKSDHIAKFHAHLPRSTFERRGGQVLVKTQPAQVLPQPHWRCAWCHEGLPKLEPAVYASSVKRHLRRCTHAPKNSSPGANAIELAKALRVPQLPRFLKARATDPVRALSALAKIIKVWECVLRQRTRLQRLGHDVRVLLRGVGSEPEPRLFFACSRCFAVKQRVHRLQKWTQRCASDDGLQALRQKKNLRTLGPKRAQLFARFDQRSRRRLCDAWNMTAAERRQHRARVCLHTKQWPANQWVRDVTADGDVEPSPGPSVSSPETAGDSQQGPDAFHLTYVNSGAFGAGRGHLSATTYWKGGLCVAAARHAGDLLVLDSEGFRVMAVTHLFGEAADSHIPCLAVGDWNDTPCESWLPALGLHMAAPMEHRAFIPSRWGGDRALDFAAFNDDTWRVQAQFDTPKFGDHKVLQLQWRAQFDRRPASNSGQRRPEAWVNADDWKEQLQGFFSDVVVEWHDDVDVQWLQLVELVEQACARALVALSGSSRDTKRRYRCKGSLPAVQPVSSHGREAGRRCAESGLVQRLCKFQGRLLEAIRHEEVDAALSARIWRDWPREVPGAFEQAGKEATRWLNNRVCALPAAVVDTFEGQTVTSRTTQEALQILTDFWRRTWNRPQPLTVLTDLEDSWRRADPVPRWDAYLDGITAAELHKKAKELRRSSAGPDGLAGCEVADLPLRFWELLWERLEVWNQRDEYPQVWRHARTVFLPKDEAAKRGGPAEAARMRPISIFGCIYRVVVSAWISHDRTRAWLQTVAPDCFHGGLQGRAAQHALRRLDAAFNSERVLVSLDFKLCFDRVDPDLALRNLAVRCPCPTCEFAALDLEGCRLLRSNGSWATVLRSRSSLTTDLWCWTTAGEENTGKVRYVTRSPHQQQALVHLGIDPSEEAVILGTVLLPQLAWGNWWTPSPDRDMAKVTTQAGLRRGLHVLRERWRRRQFDLFLKLDRHEAREIAAFDRVGYDAARVKSASVLYKDVNTEARGVMLSGGKSGEHYACMRQGKPPVGTHWCATCSLCNASVLPSWHHAAWHCTAFAATRPAVAGDAAAWAGLCH